MEHFISIDLAYRRCVIEMEMALFDAFAMISLWIRQSKKPFFEKVVLFIPEAEGNIE